MKIKKFVNEHKTQILAGTITASTYILAGVAGAYLNKAFTAKEIADGYTITRVGLHGVDEVPQITRIAVAFKNGEIMEFEHDI